LGTVDTIKRLLSIGDYQLKQRNSPLSMLLALPFPAPQRFGQHSARRLLTRRAGFRCALRSAARWFDD
jgi:hypothetical protein